MDKTKFAALVNRMKRGIAEEHPHRMPELEAAIESFEGNPYILRDILDQGRTDSPFTAAEKMPLKVTIFRTPKDKRKDPHGVSVSGHKLKDQYFLFKDPLDPTRKWSSGSQAATKFIEAFGTKDQKEALTPAGRERVQEERKEKDQEDLRKIVETLEEVLADPGKLPLVQSTNDKTYVHSLLGLQEEKDHLIQAIDKLIHGNTAFVAQEGDCYLVATDPGGMWYRRFERQLEKLPHVISDAFTTLTNPLTEMTAKERKQLQSVLIAWGAANFYEKKESIIGDVQRDLDLVMQLPDENEIIERYGRPNLKPLRRILAEPEITLIEAGRVFEAYPINEVRAEVNSSYMEQFKEEVDSALDKLESLFINEGRWQDDCYGSSIPMKRLKRTIYYVALMHKDFQSVRDFLRAKTLSVEEDGLYSAMCIEDFKRTVDSLVVSSRKLKNLDAVLQGMEIEVPRPQSAEQIIKEKGLKGLAAFRRKGDYDLAENFVLQYGFNAGEMISRLDNVFGHDKRWRSQRNDVCKDLDLGLYSKGRIKKFADLVEKVQGYTPKSDVLNQLKVALDTARSNLVIKNPHSLWEQEKDYFSPKMMDAINELVEVNEYLSQHAGEIGGENLSRLMEKRAQFAQKRFYINKEEGSVNLSDVKFVDIEPAKMIGAIKVSDLRELGSYFAEVEETYVPYSQLNENWKRKAKSLTSYPGGKLLQKTGEHVDFMTANMFKVLDENCIVHKGLIKEVENLYQSLQGAVEYEASVVSEGLQSLEEGELFDKYRVSIGGTQIEHRGEFTKVFRGYRWNPVSNAWDCLRTVDKWDAAELTETVRIYNERMNTNLHLELEKV